MQSFFKLIAVLMKPKLGPRLYRRLGFFLSLCCVMLVTQAASGANQNGEWQLQLQPPKQGTWLGQPASWTLISWSPPPGQLVLQLPESEHFLITAVRPMPVLANGRHGLAYPLRITALRGGEMQLPALRLSDTKQNVHLQTTPEAINVQLPEISSAMDLQISRSQDEIFLGQTVRLKVSWTLSYPVLALKAVNLLIPELQHPDVKVLAPWNKPETSSEKSREQNIGVPVSGRRVIARWQQLPGNKVRISFERIIQPQQAGDYVFSAPVLLANVDAKLAAQKPGKFRGSRYPAYFNNEFFDHNQSARLMQPVMVSGASFRLNVKPLPDPAPPNFSGLIGKPDIVATALPLQVKQGEPLQYSLNIQHPDIEALQLPQLKNQPSFIRSFNIISDASPAVYGVEGKTVNQTLFARRADIEAIPALLVDYFDPDSGRYREYWVETVAISVTAKDSFSLLDAQSMLAVDFKNPIEPDPEGIWAHRWGALMVAAEPENSDKLWWLLGVMPPLLVLLALYRPLRQRWLAQRSIQPYQRVRLALQQGKDPLQQLSIYAQLRLQILPSQLTCSVLQQTLQRLPTVDADLAIALVAWLRRYQQRYAQAKIGADETQQLLALLAKLEPLLPAYKKPIARNIEPFTAAILVLLVGFFATPNPVHATDLEKIKLQHQQAQQLSLDHPQKARRAHSIVAQKLQTILASDKPLSRSSLMYNIGTSWFHAGRYGYSILWLRRAENINPNDPQLQHNLATARRHRLDDLPVVFAPIWLGRLYQYSAHPVVLAASALVYVFFWWSLWRAVRGGAQYRQPLRLAAAALAFIAVMQIARQSYPPVLSDGVVTAKEVISRKGPGLIFAPAFTASLHEGTEFLLLRQQGSWSELQLSDGKNTWLPTRAVNLIVPTNP